MLHAADVGRVERLYVTQVTSSIPSIQYVARDFGYVYSTVQVVTAAVIVAVKSVVPLFLG